ncbi:ribonucleotide-diphosphate reductase subunit beta [Thiomonas sp.]
MIEAPVPAANLFTPSTAYKPFRYPWAFEYYDRQQRTHWLANEIVMGPDAKDWQAMPAAERNLLTQVFRFFVQGDVDVSEGYSMRFLRRFPVTEVRMMLNAFANVESIHMHAYSLLLDTVGMPETEYQAFKEYSAMAAKHDYLHRIPDDTIENLAFSLAVYSALIEGVQLFSSFAILLNFTRFGKMLGMGQILAYSVRDEQLHVEGNSRLFRQMLIEFPEIHTKAMRHRIQDAARDMVGLEERFIDLAFEQGPLRGLTPAEVKSFVRYIADLRLRGLGLKPIFKDGKPLAWLEDLLAGVEHANIFEVKGTEYSRGATTGSWEDVWAAMDLQQESLRDRAEAGSV